jgi:hypothetical protein
VSLFSGVQSDVEVQAEDLGFVNVRIGDPPEVEDSEFRKSPLPKVSDDLDDPYAMVPETQRQPSSSIALPAQQPQVAPLSQYFLVMDVNGILLATYYGQIGKEKAPLHHTRVREKLRDFLVFCVSNFTVVFWSSMKAENLERHFATLFSHAPELGKNCLKFAQNWCDVSTYTDPDNEGRPFFLKRLARLLGDSIGLVSRGATAENTLLVDDSSYKNVLNDPYNAIHPVTFMYFTEKNTKKKPYLIYQLWPFLKDLKDLGLPVLVYCREHSLFGSRQLFPGDEEYEHFRTVILRDQRRFDVPYIGPHILGAPYTNVGRPSDT